MGVERKKTAINNIDIKNNFLERTKELVTVGMRRVGEGDITNSGTHEIVLESKNRVYFIRELGITGFAKNNSLFIEGIQKNRNGGAAWQINNLMLPTDNSLITDENIISLTEGRNLKSIAKLVEEITAAEKVPIGRYEELVDQIRPIINRGRFK